MRLNDASYHAEAMDLRVELRVTACGMVSINSTAHVLEWAEASNKATRVSDMRYIKIERERVSGNPSSKTCGCQSQIQVGIWKTYNSSFSIIVLSDGQKPIGRRCVVQLHVDV
jgi:hypothetical protein